MQMDELIDQMKVLLGTGFALYFKVHASHWNIEGELFPSLHPFFEDIYKAIWKSLDDFAEQIRQLDAYTPSSMERLVKLSKISSENNVLPARDMLISLYQDQELFIDMLTVTLHKAEELNKQGLVNFLADRIEYHSKIRWQLRASAKRLNG
jgi:starvation-inducible DNA-binding protein